VEITITRTALAADIVPGFTIRHPDTGERSTIERQTLDLGGKVTFLARHPGAGRRHTITMGTDHEVDVLPAPHEEAGIWEAIGEAVSRANAAFHGEGVPSADNRPPGAIAPWTRLPGGEPGTLEIAAVGHRWNITAEQAGEPAEDSEG
jgi:hypothetical protein